MKKFANGRSVHKYFLEKLTINAEMFSTFRKRHVPEVNTQEFFKNVSKI